MPGLCTHTHSHTHPHWIPSQFCRGWIGSWDGEFAAIHRMIPVAYGMTIFVCAIKNQLKCRKAERDHHPPSNRFANCVWWEVNGRRLCPVQCRVSAPIGVLAAEEWIVWREQLEWKSDREFSRVQSLYFEWLCVKWLGCGGHIRYGE